MAVTAADALAFIGGAASDETEVGRCLGVATAAVTKYVGTRTVPAGVLDQVTLEVTASVFRRSSQPGQAGNPYATEMEGAVTVREPKDPLMVAAGLLDRWLPRGLA